MDANKLKVLREIGYTVRRTCSLCVHARFACSSDWGACDAHAYEHAKHERVRALSIHRAGTCARFEPDAESVERLAGFAEMLEDPGSRPTPNDTRTGGLDTVKR